MNHYSLDLEKYKVFDPMGNKSVDDISNFFGWSRQVSYTYKYFLSELNPNELLLLDNVKVSIDLGVIAAVCIQNEKYKSRLLENIERINSANSPFSEIEIFISEIADRNPLEYLKNEFWLSVGDYISQRGIDAYPFNKKTIGFIKSIGYYGYDKLTTKQKQWISDLIAADKQRVETDRFFENEYLIQKGFNKECAVIENL